MFVCSCRVVSDQAVRRAIATGAETVEAIAARSGAGTGCGSCRRTLEQLLESAGVAVAVAA